MIPADLDYWLNTLPEVTEEKRQKLQQFAAFLREWNQKINLVSRKDVAFLWEHHLLPSLWVLHAVSFRPGETIMDIGSGGGFPAIPLKIVRPDLQWILVESIRKKVHFLESAIAHLELGGITVVNERVEKLAKDSRFAGQIDTITARAVTDVATLVSWGKPLLKPGGRWVLWKGERDVPALIEMQQKLGVKADIVVLPEPMANAHPRWATTRWFIITKGK